MSHATIPTPIAPSPSGGSRADYALLTIDVWDTILRRRCHPDEVKLFTARALLLTWHDRLRPELRTPIALLHLRQLCEQEIGLEAKGVGMDDEYRLPAVLERWAARALMDSEAHHATAFAARAQHTEVEQEKRVAFADQGIQALLATANGVRRVGLSDFYLSSAQIASLIELKAPHIHLDEIVVSCDVGLNKRSGRLYNYIQNHARVTPGQHAHIGDHPDVDVGTPHRMGVQAIHYAPPDQEARRAVHRERWDRRNRSTGLLVHAMRRDIADAVRAPDRLTTDQAEMYYFGARCAPLYVGLVLRAIEEALRRGIQRVHYFTREGVFFQRIHDALLAAAPAGELLGTPLPGSELLEVSRLATFCASLREVTPREFMRIWNLYSTQSIAGLLATLDIPEISVRPLLEIHGLQADEPIQYPWLDPRIQALLADRRFIGTVNRARDHRRRILREYLALRGFHDDGAPKVIVDIGWRGTIQDNLAHIYPSSSITGVYLGMHRVLNEQPVNAIKIPFACDAAIDEAVAGRLLEHVQPYEALSNSPDGSVRGYTRAPGTQGIHVERLLDPDESAMWETTSRHFQNGVLAAVPVIARWIQDYAFGADDLRPMAIEALKDIIAAPPVPVCNAFFRLRHNETFGLGGFVDMHQADATGLARRARADPAAGHELYAICNQSRWPCAFLRSHGLEQERLDWARWKFAHAPLVDVSTADPNHATWAISQIQSTRSYRLLHGITHSWPMRLLNRLRFGRGWDVPIPDPVARLAALRRSRAYRILHAIRHSSWSRARAIRRYGMDALDRW